MYYERGRGGSRAFKSNQGQSAHRQRMHQGSRKWSSKLCTSWFWSSIIVYLQVVVLQIVRAPSGPQNCEPLQVVVLQIVGLLVLVLKIVHLLVLILKIVRLLAELWSSKLCASTPGCGPLNQVLHMLAL